MKSLTPAVSRAARSEASGGHQPGTGWRRLDQPVRLGSVGRIGQVHSWCVRFECPQKPGKRPKRRMKVVRLVTGNCAVELLIALFGLS
jgi:hypothetical protein